MAGLQRSAVSFRRQGSSGLIWDDKFLGELNKESERQKEEQAAAAAAGGGELQQDNQDQNQVQSELIHDQKGDNAKDVKPVRSINTMERSRSNGGARGYRTGRVSPAIEPPSPRVSACGFCGAFGKASNSQKKRSGKRRSRQV
ncbi:Plant/F18B13-26 protein [Melia azedarach]|uniref:Plant/F18B13-26 protein n=1 Tax=Melia azedarach TaxID=155640 RepID=A0ACC1Y3S6_MELAZ|nr:Plant/F18B13-26 protein [Melia azedarach]